MRALIAIVVAVCALAAAAPATPVKPPAKKDRYLAWVELDVTDSWRRHRDVVEDGCRKTSHHGLTHKLTLRSGWQSVLVATRNGKTTSLGGTLRALVGELVGSGSGYDRNSCLGYIVITDYPLPLRGPVQISGATLDVRADRGKPVAFANLRSASWYGPEINALVNALAQAPALVTTQHLRESRFRKVEVTGSHDSGTTDPDGTVRSLVVNWKLTIRALPKK